MKNPYKIKNIHKGVLEHLSASNKNGPMPPILIKNFGEQIMPIPAPNGLKFSQNGKENATDETEIIKIGLTESSMDFINLLSLKFLKKIISSENMI